MTWPSFGLSLVLYEVFLIGTQWWCLDGISITTTIVFTVFFLVILRPWTLARP